MSFYEPSPTREWRWMRAIWSGRARTEVSWWRLYFVVEVDGAVVGMQDLIAEDFPTFKGVTTFSWLAPQARGRGIGREMRAAILDLAFTGLGAREATSEAFADNTASNAVSRALGYEENGTDWATRRGSPCELRRWTLSRARWQAAARPEPRRRGLPGTGGRAGPLPHPPGRGHAGPRPCEGLAAPSRPHHPQERPRPPTSEDGHPTPCPSRSRHHSARADGTCRDGCAK